MTHSRAESRVVVLNGPAGVGKTTIARLLAARFASAACIHGDVLSEFVVRREDGAVGQGLGYVNGASIATNFIEAGYDLVVFEYVFETPAALETFRSAYTASAPVHVFTLWASLTTVRGRERGRAGRRPLGTRIEACYRSIEGRLDTLGRRVDTDSLSPDEVVARLLALCDD